MNKIGILITNLGTPSAPTPKALRRYLKEFLSDSRVVEIPRWLWWCILHGIILRIRPRYSAKLYNKILTKDGSPLLHISKKQAQGLQANLDKKFPNQFQVELAMRYGSPSIAEALTKLQRSCIEKLIIFPLYPQYSGVSTGSTFDKVAEHLKTWRSLPAIQFINQYANHESYISALANSIRQHWQQNPPGQTLLFSFHGIPQRNINLGDTYEKLCYQTAQAVAEKLQLDKDQWQVVFQSRFGKQKWLEPYCDLTLQKLAQAGVQSVDIICPGFAADCLETLEEIQIRNQAIYKAAGGQSLNYIPALNDAQDHLTVLTDIILSASNFPNQTQTLNNAPEQGTINLMSNVQT
jgi:ferrochelatase